MRVVWSLIAVSLVWSVLACKGEAKYESRAESRGEARFEAGGGSLDVVIGADAAPDLLAAPDAAPALDQGAALDLGAADAATDAAD
jgi:hypothetical protein